MCLGVLYHNGSILIGSNIKLACLSYQPEPKTEQLYINARLLAFIRFFTYSTLIFL